MTDVKVLFTVEAQCRLTAKRSTIDQFFTLRQLTGKYEQFEKDLHVCHIDFRNTFDSIWRKHVRNNEVLQVPREKS